VVQAKLPISDYVNDTNSVMDQIPRLLAAMQFLSQCYLSSAGSLDLFCMFSTVRQVISTRMMVIESPLKQIPGINFEKIRILKSLGVQSLFQLCTLQGSKAKKIFHSLFDTNEDNDDAFKKSYEHLMTIPLVSATNINLYINMKKSTGNNICHLKFDLILDGPKNIYLGRLNDKTKDKDVNLSILLGTLTNSLLLSVKSVSIQSLFKRRRKNINMKFNCNLRNENGSKISLCLRIMNESMRGLDIEYVIPLEQDL